MNIASNPYMRASTMRMYSFFRLVLLVLLVFCYLPKMPLYARAFESTFDSQEAIKDIERKQLETERKLREKEKLEKSRQSVTGHESAEQGDDAIKFMIKEIKLENDELLSDREKRKLIEPYLNHMVGMNDINTLIMNITNTLIKKGYVTTRVKIPLGQSLSSGKLVLQVLIGYIEEIRPEQNTLRNQMRVFDAFPYLIHKPLDINDLDYGIEQMNKVRSGNATMKIEPGTEIGGSKVIISNEPRFPLSLDVGFDNLGQDTTGVYRKKITLSVDNIASLNDTLYVDYVSSMVKNEHRKKSECYTFNYSFPLGYWTFGVLVSHSEYLRYIRGLNIEFQASGDDTSKIFNLDRVVWRSKYDRIKARSSLSVKKVNNYIEDSLIETSSKRLTVAKLGLEYSGFFLGGFFSSTVTYDRGLNAFNAYKDDSSLSEDTPRAQFNKYGCSALWNFPFALLSQNFTFMCSANGQCSTKPLYNSEKMCIGDMNTVRGFSNGAAVGDKGWYVRNELSVTDFSRFWDYLKGLRIFIGYDFGYVLEAAGKGSNYGEGEAKLMGWASGVCYTTSVVNINITYARKILLPRYVKADDHVLYVVATTNLTEIGSQGVDYFFLDK